MKKKLSILIAIAISLSVSTVSFAAEIQSGDKLTLNLEQALNSVEKSNQELKFIDDKINALNTQYDRDKQQEAAIDASNKVESQYPNGQYLSVMLQKNVVPLKNQQNIDDQKNVKEERLNFIKFDLEKEYMNAVTSKAQLDNINKNIANLDEQIKQTQAKISLGQLTKDTLNPLNAERSKLVAQLPTPKTQMQKSLLNIKKYINIDLNKDLDLVYTKKQFIKFNDADIETKIKSAANDDYTISSIHKNINIAKTNLSLCEKYEFDSKVRQLNAKLGLQDLQNKLEDTATIEQVNLWKAYYNLKNKEDAVQAQLVGQQYAEMAYSKAKLSFSQGLVDKIILDSAELAFNNQKVTTEQAINEYMVTQEQFNYILNGHNSLAAQVVPAGK